MSKGKITPRAIELLHTLYWVNLCSKHPIPWARPLDLGAANGSHHSGTLRTLEGWGLVQSKIRGWPDPKPDAPRMKLGKGQRGSRVYRITDNGAEAIKDRW